MKNFLIPTVLHPDTITAVKAAIAQSAGKQTTITLLQLQSLQESYSAASLLRSMRTELTATQCEVLELTRYVVATESHCKIKIHTQYSLSSPLLKNLLESLSVDLIILTDSFKTSDSSINKYCLQLLGNCKQAILHVTEGIEKPEFNNALYIEKDKSKLQVEDLQQLVNERFSFKIVSRATIFEDQDATEIMPQLSETISRNNIDLLVETRKPKQLKRRKGEEKSLSETTGLPVLSFYEKVM